MSINNEHRKITINVPTDKFQQKAYDNYKQDVTTNYQDILDNNNAIQDIKNMTIDEITDNRYTKNFINAELGVSVDMVYDAIINPYQTYHEIHFSTDNLDENKLEQLKKRCNDLGYSFKQDDD